MSSFSKPSLLGMVHIGALPGTPFARDPVETLLRVAVDEARSLVDAGFDGLIIENMHDRPYVHADPPAPEIIAGMTRVGAAVRAACPSVPLGVQILSGGNRAAIAVAHSIGAQFIRCENFVFSHVADEGLLERAEAGPLLRYRRSIGAETVSVFCDLKKKHASHAITADVSLGEAAEAASFFGADGLIVTGTATGHPTSPEDVRDVRSNARGLPVLVGSGVTPESVPELLAHADALIVGSWIKRDGVWSNPIDPERVRAMSEAFSAARDGHA